MVKNPPANAEDTDLIPDPGRSPMLQSNQLLSLCSRAHVLQQGKPPQWEAHVPPLESSPCSLQLEKSNKDPTWPKMNKIILKNQ